MSGADLDRRSFLRFALASPLLLGADVSAVEGGGGNAETEWADGPLVSARTIEAARDAINIFDLRVASKERLNEAHFEYLSLGTDDEVTLRANRHAFERFKLRPRRLVDTRNVDTKLELLGTQLASPLILAPCGSQKAFHPEGELATARAAGKTDHLMILSASSSVELAEVVRARREPLWAQLPYPGRLPLVTRSALGSAEEAGCTSVVLTVDIVNIGENRDRIDRFHRDDNPECQSCHGGALDSVARGAESVARAFGFEPNDLASNMMVLDWEFVERVRSMTKLNLVIKGILTHEDARLCVENGIDAIVVSNHGGRAEDSGLATIEALPEIVDAVAGRIPILVDSGFRRGTDVFKALALGATAVCVGRPYLWGLSAFGEDGVVAALDLLQRELVMAMKAMGTPSLADITSNHVLRAG